MLVNQESCFKALRTCVLSRRQNLCVEMAIGIAVLANDGTVSLPAKRAVADLYEQADSDCTDRTGTSYRTIRRRVDAAALLFDTIGNSAVRDIIGTRRNGAAISVLADHVESLKLHSIDAIFEHCGKPRKVAEPDPAPTMPRWRHVESAHLILDIPPEVTADEADELAGKLHSIADRLRKIEAKAG